MRITSAEFILSAVLPSHFPEDNLPDIALVGRSNVGKSSLINTITNRKALAKPSSSPGKTRTMNFYRINNEFYIVDLPGYGFARVSKNEKKSWKQMIEGYFEARKNIKAVLIILDVRHKPSKEDIMVFEWLADIGIPIIPVITKIDKVSRNNLSRHIKAIKDTIHSNEFILFSAVTKDGRLELLKRIMTNVSA